MGEGSGGEGRGGKGRGGEGGRRGRGRLWRNGFVIYPPTSTHTHALAHTNTQTTHTHLSPLPTHLGQCLGELLKQVVAVELTVVVDIELRRDIRNAAQLGGRGEESK